MWVIGAERWAHVVCDCEFEGYFWQGLRCPNAGELVQGCGFEGLETYAFLGFIYME